VPDSVKTVAFEKSDYCKGQDVLVVTTTTRTTATEKYLAINRGSVGAQCLTAEGLLSRRQSPEPVKKEQPQMAQALSFLDRGI